MSTNQYQEMRNRQQAEVNAFPMCISPSPRMDSSIWILWEAPQ